ncbi:MAG: Stealth CR1 domain-containing protein [Bacteroidales bacterium]|nr:Stealth CR1 domain-containing protein [Bacteroidales bacterium]
MEDNVDFVITWVDDSDPDWRKDFDKSSGNIKFTESNDPQRYRSWDNLQYLFRGIEKFAPWVNRVHLVTNGQKPKWLNLNCPKLNFVTHDDYIPQEFLPTFSARTIMLNFHRINGLADKFVYFNDDFFLCNNITKKAFFKGSLPCDMPIQTIPSLRGNREYTLLKAVSIINKHFDKRTSIWHYPQKWFSLSYGIKNILKNIYLSPYKDFSAFGFMHRPYPLLKSTYEELWENERIILCEACSHKFRDVTDINPEVIRYWQFASGSFHPKNITKDTFAKNISDKTISEYIDVIENQRYPIVVVNDSDAETITDFALAKLRIKEAFDLILPEKSTFEI